MARSSLRQFKVQCSKVRCELPPCCALTQTESQFQSLQLFNRSAPRNAAARSSRSTASLRSRRIRLTSVPTLPKFHLFQSFDSQSRNKASGNFRDLVSVAILPEGQTARTNPME